MDNWSIRKKITAVFAFLVLLPAALLGSAIIRNDVVRKNENAAADTRFVLQLMAEDIKNRSSRVEYLIGLLATSKSIGSIFDQHIGYGEYARRLNNEVETEIYDMAAYLYELGASIVVLTDEALPERYEVLMNKARFLPNEDIESLTNDNRSGWGMPGWHMPEGHRNDAYYVRKTIPYYQLIVTDWSVAKGVIKCSIVAERLFEILETWDGADPICVVRGDEVVYSTGEWETGLSLNGDESLYRQNGKIYIAVPIQGMDMSLLTRIPGISLKEILPTTALTGGLICLFVLVLLILARAILGRVLIGFNDINSAIDELNSGRDNAFRLPTSGQDEIGRLFGAVNRLLDVHWAQNQRLIEQERNMHTAQILALQCQMNPHFLFNALNWLQLSIETGRLNEETSDAVAHLSNVLHYNMVASYISTIGEELDSLNEYKAFLDARYIENIHISVECPDEIREEHFLRFTLQPLVENAIRHGRREGKELHVDIVFRLCGDMIYLCVRNDGLPLSETEAVEINECLQGDNKHTSEGVGLYNLARRLHLVHHSVRMEMANRNGYVTLEIYANRLCEVTNS